jgi:ketosteroid isomerase-like protein
VIRNGGFRVDVHPDEILVQGDIAFVRGSIELTHPSTNGESERTELRYLEIARRQRDSSWQVMWGMDGPIQDYTPSP